LKRREFISLLGGDAALVRLSRCREHALCRLDAALRHFRLYSLRVLFHAHPAKFSNLPNEFVRLLPCRPIGRFLMFAGHFRGRSFLSGL
jgi:hypothetical protein